VVQQGRLFRVASVQDGPFGASEYVAGDGGRVVVFGWWGPHQLGARPHRVRLAGLEPDARYRDVDTGFEHRGAALMQAGIELPGGTGGDFGSALIRLVRA
jgi:alpha-galactosidase